MSCKKLLDSLSQLATLVWLAHVIVHIEVGVKVVPEIQFLSPFVTKL